MVCRMVVLQIGSNMPCNEFSHTKTWIESFNSSTIVYGRKNEESAYYRVDSRNGWSELRLKHLHNWGKKLIKKKK